MTTSKLLLWIVLGISFQLALAILVGLWRKRPGANAAAPGVSGENHSAAKTGSWRTFRVTKREFEDPAQTQCSFYLESTDGLPLADYAPGQYLTFLVPIADPAAPGGVRVVTRCYSLSQAARPTQYRVTIKRASPPAEQPTAPPGVSSNHFHDHVHVGNVLRIRSPSGHFFLDTTTDMPVVLIAGGIGITPMMSMLQWLVEHEPGRLVHLFYGVRNGYEHAFKDQLRALAATHPQFHLHVVYSRQAPEDRIGEDFHFAGRIDVALLASVLGGVGYQFYLCGPSALMNTLVPALLDWGLPDNQLHFEAFGPSTVRKGSVSATTQRAPDGERLEIRFEKSGRMLEWTGADENLLDFAEKHGVEVNSGCRSGGCGCCETRLISGEVHYVQPPDHDIAPGHCLLCAAKPTSALILEA